MTAVVKLVVFVATIILAFVYLCNVVPQIESQPALAATIEIGESPQELVAAGRDIFMGDRAQCLTCHSLGEDPKARCPNQEGLGERAGGTKPGFSAARYLVESLYNPNAYVVEGYPKDQMTPVNLPPIGLSHDEILALIAYLNTLGGRSDGDFVDQVRVAQDPWRQGLLRPDEGTDRATLPVFAGDAERGWAVFEGQNCIRCHRIGEEGADVGPELTAIGASQGPQYILESILDPSAVIVKGYMRVNVIWKQQGRLLLQGVPLEWIPGQENPQRLRLSVDDLGVQVEQVIDLSEVEAVGDTIVGTSVDGVFTRYCGDYLEGDEESGVTLRILEDGRWVERRIAAEAIQFVNGPNSPMPANFADLLTPRQLYDLLAALASLRGQP